MISKIENDDDHTAALRRASEIFHAEPGTPEGAELDALADLIVAYEQEHYPMPELHRIASVEPGAHGQVHLLWDSGEAATLDVSDLFSVPAFAALRDPAFFAQVHVSEYRYDLEWPGDLGICGDRLWEETLAALARPCP